MTWTLDKTNARAFLRSVKPDTVERYEQYWNTITPETNKENYLRWIFAIASVHTSWTSNVRGYLALKPLMLRLADRKRLEKRDKLLIHNTIRQCRLGLAGVRVEALHQLCGMYRRGELDSADREYSPEERHADVQEIFGLGLAKTSFAYELINPISCEVVCLDTHMLQLFGYPKGGSPSDYEYDIMETAWLTECIKARIPAPIARHIFWDRKQGFPDTRYWSYVFEEKYDDRTTSHYGRRMVCADVA